MTMYESIRIEKKDVDKKLLSLLPALQMIADDFKEKTGGGIESFSFKFERQDGYPTISRENFIKEILVAKVKYYDI